MALKKQIKETKAAEVKAPEKDVEMHRQLGGWLRSSHPLKKA